MGLSGDQVSDFYGPLSQIRLGSSSSHLGGLISHSTDGRYSGITQVHLDESQFQNARSAQEAQRQHQAMRETPPMSAYPRYGGLAVPPELPKTEPVPVPEDCRLYRRQEPKKPFPWFGYILTALCLYGVFLAGKCAYDHFRAKELAKTIKLE